MKVYISRDELGSTVWLWKKPIKGNWKPEKLADCEVVVYARPESMHELDSYDAYTDDDFKTKFGKDIKEGTCQQMELKKELVNSEDYKMFSNDTDRKTYLTDLADKAEKKPEKKE